MIKVRKDLTGQRFGRMVVLRQHEEDYVFPSGRKSAMWVCRCDCDGKEFVSRGWDISVGDVLSCGCLMREINGERGRKQLKKYNTYDLSGEYGIGYTEEGDDFWFDLEDYDKIKDYYWGYHDGYVETKDVKTGKIIKLHRLIMSAKDGDIIDHKIHPPRKEHKKDNRKSNLRIVTSKENAYNTSLSTANTSGVKGVYYQKDYGKWFAKIKVNGKDHFRGYFDLKEDAVKARKELEEIYQGEYSYDNSQAAITIQKKKLKVT